MDTGTLQGVGTILAMAAFLGICVWAWSSKNKADFDEAAQLPFADDLAQEKESSQAAEKQPPQDNQTETGTEQDVEKGAGHE